MSENRCADPVGPQGPDGLGDINGININDCNIEIEEVLERFEAIGQWWTTGCWEGG